MTNSVKLRTRRKNASTIVYHEGRGASQALAIECQFAAKRNKTARRLQKEAIVPAILTHDFFGQDVYSAHSHAIGKSTDERDAFLLGNQGPDPLFYLVLSPSLKPFFGLGGTMHHNTPSKLMAALKESLDVLEDEEKSVGRAYAFGFLCHYSLDRAMHPLVYSQQYAICDAGIEGLDRSQGNEVHAEIEREFDEMVLFSKLGRTIRTYKPHEETLHASDETLATIGKMYAFVSMKAYRLFPSVDLFPSAVRDFRRVQRLFYSPSGNMQSMLDTVETRVMNRSFSFYKSMSHRNNATRTSDFDNRMRKAWENPFTHEIQTESFWDIFDGTKAVAFDAISAFNADEFDEKAAEKLTRGLNFSGDPVE